MNRLNRIIDVLNEVIAEYMYVMIWTEDKDKRREGMKGIEEVLKVRRKWEGIRESVRKGVR